MISNSPLFLGFFLMFIITFFILFLWAYSQLSLLLPFSLSCFNIFAIMLPFMKMISRDKRIKHFLVLSWEMGGFSFLSFSLSFKLFLLYSSWHCCSCCFPSSPLRAALSHAAYAAPKSFLSRYFALSSNAMWHNTIFFDYHVPVSVSLSTFPNYFCVSLFIWNFKIHFSISPGEHLCPKFDNGRGNKLENKI